MYFIRVKLEKLYGVLKYTVLFCGLIATLGNFFPGYVVWGFDHFYLGLPYAKKSFLSFMAVLFLSTYPFVAKKYKLYDFIYYVVAVLIISFLIVYSYILVRDVIDGIDPLDNYRVLHGADYNTSSVFFPYINRLVINVFFVVYLVYTMFFFRLFSLRESVLVCSSVILSVFSVTYFLLSRVIV